MVRDANTNHPGVKGTWFRVREDGKYIKPPTPPPGVSSDDPALGWISLDSFRTTPKDPLDSRVTTTPSASQFLTVADFMSDTNYDLYLDRSSTVPSDDTDVVDLTKYGLHKSNPIILEVKNDDDGPGREYHPDFPGKIGYWFVVQDEKEDNIDVSDGATAVSENEPSLGWNPLPKDPDLPSDIWHAGSGLVKGKICKSLDLDPRDYQVYVSQSDNASDFLGDSSVIDFRTVGSRGNNPMLVKYYIVKNSDSGSDGGDNEDNGQDNDSGNNNDDTTDNTDPYINFTKRLENITTGDWDIYYPDAIPGTYNGEILWTDGDSSYSFATAPNIQAYKVVRREPSVYNGRVIQTGLASASTYYFKLLD